MSEGFSIRDKLTLEEVENSYEWKLVKRILIREYPWIVDAEIDAPNLDKYNIIFINIYIDPIKFYEQYDKKLASYVKFWLSREKPSYSASYLSVLFDMDYEDYREIENELTSTIRGVKKSVAIPQELKLPESRPFSISEFIIDLEKLKPTTFSEFPYA